MKSVETQSKLVDVEEAAGRLGVSPRFVRRLVSERRIGFFKVGRFIRFDIDELNSWLASCRVEPSRDGYYEE